MMSNGKSLRILIVDDSTTMRKIIARTLALAPLGKPNIEEAGDGAEALKLMETSIPDIIFLDVNMPIMTGTEMLRRMRSDPRFAGIPVLIVSTEGSQKRLDELHSLGAEIIRKPFTPEVVIDLLGRMIPNHVHIRA